MTDSDVQTGFDYPMGDGEVDRLSSQHEVITDAFEGNYLVPDIKLDTSSKLRILDSGTADGVWLRDLAPTLGPNKHEYIGTDLMVENFPKKETWPENTTLIGQDINKPWPEEWKESFDLVHQRLTLVAGGGGQKQALENLAALVKPGGWICIIETNNQSPENNGPIMKDMMVAMRHVFSAFGGSPDVTQLVPGWLKEFGFTDVGERIYIMNLGAANKDRKLGNQGVFTTCKGSGTVVSFAQGLGVEDFPVPKERLATLTENLKKELLEQGGYFPLKCIWARKKTA